MPDPFKTAKDADRKRAQRLCITFRCTNRAIKHKHQCATCRSAVYRHRYPMKYHFNLLRCGASRRKIEFTLTYEEYEKFCLETGYHEKRGKQPASLTIDRKDATRGYSYDNIQVLTHAENSARQDKPWFTGYFGYYVKATKYRCSTGDVPDPEKVDIADEGVGHDADDPGLPLTGQEAGEALAESFPF